MNKKLKNINKNFKVKNDFNFSNSQIQFCLVKVTPTALVVKHWINIWPEDIVDKWYSELFFLMKCQYEDCSFSAKIKNNNFNWAEVLYLNICFAHLIFKRLFFCLLKELSQTPCDSHQNITLLCNINFIKFHISSIIMVSFLIRFVLHY